MSGNIEQLQDQSQVTEAQIQQVRQEFERVLKRPNCNILMYGRANARKTSLCSALLTDKSSGGVLWSYNHGTGEIETKQCNSL